jgi:surface protein
MFAGMSRLQYLNLKSFDTRSVERMEAMFMNDTNLQTIYSNSFDRSSLKDNGQDMFA